ncbi:MAG: DnaB-like helicase C-terminal domain-containing protein [Aminipila sp.]
MNQQQAYEEQLIGSWLMGANTEYIPQIKSFAYWDNILKCMQKLKTVDVFQISKESKTSMTELMRMRKECLPVMFEPSYRACKTEDIKTMLKELLRNPKSIDVEKTVTALTKEIDLLNCLTEEIPQDPFAAYLDELNRRTKEEPMKYGIPRIDYITGGIHRQELTVIAARPSIGKSALALQMATNIANKGKKVAFFSLEMSREQITERMMCRITDVPHDRLKNPKTLTDNDWKKIGYAGDVIPKTLDIYDRTLNLGPIVRVIDKGIHDLIVIDYAQLMRAGGKFNNKQEEITHITNTLKRTTKSTGTPIILLAQLNRTAQDKPPTLAELKGSGSIEEDADNVLFIHKPTRADIEKIDCFRGRYEFFEARNERPTVLMQEKNRNGKTGITYAIYLGDKFIFREVT